MIIAMLFCTISVIIKSVDLLWPIASKRMVKQIHSKNQIVDRRNENEEGKEGR